MTNYDDQDPVSDYTRTNLASTNATASEQAEYANNCVATGAVLMALHTALGQLPTLQRVDVAPDAESNQIDVEFEFLNSPYRITVERLDRPKEGL